MSDKHNEDENQQDDENTTLDDDVSPYGDFEHIDLDEGDGEFDYYDDDTDNMDEH